MKEGEFFMSKKMMRRSLALGALMAFVITGSAMAGDLVNPEGKKDYMMHIGNGETKSYDNVNIVHTTDGTIIAQNSGGTLDVKGTLKADAHCNNIYMGDKVVSGAVLNVYAPVIELVGTDTSGAVQMNSENTTINIEKFNEFVIKAIGENDKVPAGVANGVRAYDKNGIVNITGNDNSTFTIEAANNGLCVDNAGARINIKNVGELTITSYGFDEGKAVKGNAITVTGGSVDIQAGTVILNSAGKASGAANDKVDGNAIYAKNGTVTLNADTTEINGTVKVLASEAGTNVTLKGKNITIDGKGGRGVNVANGTAENVAGSGSVILGSDGTEAINIKNASIGICVQYNGTAAAVEVNGSKLNITDSTYGIWAMNGNLTDNNVTDNAKIVIGEGTSTNIETKYYGIVNTSQAVVDVNGELSVNAPYAIMTRGEAITDINVEGGNLVQIKGDILFGDGTKDESDVIDATINLNLDKAGSYFKGSIYTADIDDKKTNRGNEVNGMNISFAKDTTWDLTGASIVNNANFAAGSVLKINGADFVESTGVYALNGAGEKATLTVEKGAKLEINGITETTYNIATGFDNLANTKDKWDVSDVNALMQGIAWTTEKGLQVEVFAKEASDMAADTGISTSTAGLVQSIIENANNASTPAEKAAVEFIEKVQANNSNPAAVGAAINAATKMGEAGGNSATAASIVKNVTGVTNDRLSFNCGHSAPHKGGHGVGLFEEGSGADIWVEYVHGKDEVEDMPSTAGKTSYEGQYNGIVMGVDFKKVNKFQSGIAFNYGEGDTNSLGSSVRTHSDYDFWGVGYYGNIHNDDSNVIFDINYAKTDSDVTQYNSSSILEASPETTTWSAGVKLEKLYQNENVQIVPYTGLRYMSIDADDYSTKKGEFYYSMDRQDIWLLPLGVSIRQEVANDNGWTVSPRVDLSYIWAFGDTNSNMEVKSPFPGVSQIGYDVMDDGSFLGLVGIEAHKGQWGYGVAYSYQKGDHSESKKWYVDVNYSF